MHVTQNAQFNSNRKERAILTLRSSIVFLAVVLFSLVPAAEARGVKSDVYFGYSRVGANLYNVYTPGMNGWQAAAHFKPFPFVGIEGDVSRFSANAGAGSQNVTLVMFGPRVTVRAKRLQCLCSRTRRGCPRVEQSCLLLPRDFLQRCQLALGGGADVPMHLGFQLRMTGDYLGNAMRLPRVSPAYVRLLFRAVWASPPLFRNHLLPN